MTRPPAGDRTRWLPEAEAFRLLAGYRLPVIAHRLATTPEEAAQAARDLDCPVALLNVATPEDAGAAFTTTLDRLTPHPSRLTIQGILVAKMAAPGTEVIVGMVRDPQFGPAVMVGLGGIFVELYQDVAFRLPPLSPAEARAMLGELKAAPLLTGYRGQPPRDLDALAACACAVARIAAEHPEIQEIDLNPIIAHERGCMIVDAKILVHE
ncbi:MAG: acetate--CoA ligase family protein [candidate division NC10 bacterium]|nr:acetate--CoA ligase family protein [candidate division NC10 bacterium]